MIEESKKNLIIFIVSCVLLLSLIVGGIYWIAKSKKAPSSDTVNNPINEESEEENEENKNEENKNEEKENNNNNSDNKKKEENKNNNNDESIIKPTFLLDNKKTMMGLQSLIEVTILVAAFFKYFKEDFTNSFKEKYASWYYGFAFPFLQIKDNFSKMLASMLSYIIVHALINCVLPLIFKFASKNRYSYLLKNYWKNNFNNFANPIILIISIFAVPYLIFVFSYYFLLQKE